MVGCSQLLVFIFTPNDRAEDEPSGTETLCSSEFCEIFPYKDFKQKKWVPSSWKSVEKGNWNKKMSYEINILVKPPKVTYTVLVERM